MNVLATHAAMEGHALMNMENTHVSAQVTGLESTANEVSCGCFALVLTWQFGLAYQH